MVYLWVFYMRINGQFCLCTKFCCPALNQGNNEPCVAELIVSELLFPFLYEGGC